MKRILVLRGGATVVMLLIGYLAASRLLPVLPGSARYGLAHLLSFPTLVGTALLIAGLFLGYRLFVLSDRKWAGATLVLVVLSMAAVLGPARVVEDSHNLRVITWNAHGEASATVLKPLLVVKPEVVVLTETGPVDIQMALTEFGIDDYQQFTSAERGGIKPTTLLISKRLGTYRQTPGIETEYGSVTAEPSRPGNPIVVGVHLVQPFWDTMEQWRAELAEVASLVNSDPTGNGIIVAGDFNATLAYGVLASCRAVPLPVASGTWPANVHPWMGAQIDQVLIGGTIKPVAAYLHQAPVSDHRAVIADIVVPGVLVD